MSPKFGTGLHIISDLLRLNAGRRPKTEDPKQLG
jgi:hypothetical protein